MSLISFSPIQDGVTSVNAAATNTPLSTIYNDYNGNITDANISASAAIAGSKVAIQAAQITPAMRTGGFKIGTLTPNATGNLSVTGVGFKPKLVRFAALTGSNTSNASGGFGAMDANGNQYAAYQASQSGTWGRNGDASHCLMDFGAGSPTTGARATYVSMDTDGFTINVSATSTFTYAYECYG